jgi:tetratricopeptide (TPR) repeat protein
VLDQAAEVAPRSAQVFYERGNVWFSLNEAARAIDDFSRALDQPDEAVSKCFIYQQRGLAHSRLGRYAEARDDWQQSLNLEPDSAPVHNHLARLLASSPATALRDPKRAVALATKAAEMQRTEGTFWNTLGVAQYRTGDWSAAIDALNRSMMLRDRGDAFDWYFLAMAEWQHGNKDEARHWYDKAAVWRAEKAKDNEELQRFEAEARKVMEMKEDGG